SPYARMTLRISTMVNALCMAGPPRASISILLLRRAAAILGLSLHFFKLQVGYTDLPCAASTSSSNFTDGSSSAYGFLSSILRRADAQPGSVFCVGCCKVVPLCSMAAQACAHIRRQGDDL